MKFAKKLTVLMLAFLMVLSVAGCSGLKVVKEIASVNGNIISKAEFMYYLENVKNQMLQEAQITAGTEEAETFWSGDIDGQKAADVAKNKAMEECIRIEIASILAKEAGLEIPSETKTNIKATIEAGGEQIEQIKGDTGLNDDLLKALFEKSEYANLYSQHLAEKEADKVTPPEEEVAKKYTDEYVRVKHVLISKTPAEEAPAQEVAPVDETAEPVADETAEAVEETEPAVEEATEEAVEETAAAAAETEDPAEAQKKFEAEQKAKAEDVLKKAKAGEDFDALVAEFGEDPGVEQSPNGYTFTKNGGMVKEFEDAAFALEIDGISELVETDYGWHILKRYSLLTEGEEYTQYINSIKTEMSSDLFNEYIDSLKEQYDISISQGTLDGIKVK